ncbi:hypothetical protein CPB84DRAFT_1941866 [Gymnopilus junonius]|uniref:Uncharacterized protein n=1 Tax=Gymnopilus junonius TaxID=109634 RepID=A0A9P5NJ43_GYMJU|nr:hypothetical protein CPB84DRAFT_1941866 [Gymnopilus junonius]
MFVVPVGALFAFSSIRPICQVLHLDSVSISNWGTKFYRIDKRHGLFRSVHIIPVLVIMSFCSFGLLLTVLYRRIYDEVKKTQRQRDLIAEKVTPVTTPRLPNFSFLDLPRIHSQRSSSDVTRAEAQEVSATQADHIGQVDA